MDEKYPWKKRYFWSTKCVRLGNVFTIAYGTSFQFFIVTGNMILRIVTTPRGPVQVPLTLWAACLSETQAATCHNSDNRSLNFHFNLQCLMRFCWRCLCSLLTCGRNAGKLDHGLLQITILTCITIMWGDNKSIVMKTSRPRPSKGIGYCWIQCQSGLLLSKNILQL